MRILLITTDFPHPGRPTNAVFNESLAAALADEHDVRVVAPVPWTEQRAARRRGIETVSDTPRHIGSAAVYHPRYLYPPKILRPWYHLFYAWSVRSTVARLTDGWTPDLVLSYWAHPDGAVAAEIARATGARSAVLVGGSDVLVLPRTPMRRRAVVRALRSVDRVVTVSRHLRETVIALGVDPGRVVVQAQGVDGRFTPGDRAVARQHLLIGDEERMLVWVGRLTRIKGLDVLLPALVPLLRQDPRVRLYLVGEGEQRDALRTQAQRLGVAEEVRFVGPCRHHDLPDWYRAADLTVLPSRSEGLPNVLRESLACGTPFVASRVGGVAEIAAPGWAELVPPEDPPALAAAIARMLQSPRPAEIPPGLLSWSESARQLVRRVAPAAAAAAAVPDDATVAIS